MKQIILLSTICLFLWVAVVGAEEIPQPLVKLLFDDANAISTVNLGSLGGIQNLPPVSGWKSADTLPPVGFDSGKAWVQAGYAPTGYGDFNLPGMSSFTVAFWVDAIYADNGFRNIFGSNCNSLDEEFGANVQGADLYLRGPGGYGYIIAYGVIPTATPTWTHVAYTYDSATEIVWVYINGQSVIYNGEWFGTLPAASDGLGFSIANSTSSNNLYGLLDNLFIFDSVLTQNQVQGLMVTNTPVSCGGALAADLNKDCYVNFGDLAVLAEEWLRCVDPANTSCETPWN